jgi:hypothetical protein
MDSGDGLRGRAVRDILGRGLRQGKGEASRVEANVCRRLVVLFSVFISFSLLPRSYPLLPYR